jgi:hypothetical protein
MAKRKDGESGTEGKDELCMLFAVAESGHLET